MSASCWTETVSTSTPSEASMRRPSSTWAARIRCASPTSMRSTPWLIVFTKSWRTSATRQPSAEVIPGRAGTSTRGDGEFTGQRYSMERAGPAEREEHEVAGVVAALERDQADGACHLVVGHPHDRAGHFFRAEPQVGADLLVED